MRLEFKTKERVRIKNIQWHDSGEAKFKLIHGAKFLLGYEVGSGASQCLISTRPEQPDFRDELLREFSWKCAASGCNVAQILQAAHIKPWSKCKPKEKRDTDNGLILTANLHILFDRGMISFSDDGALLKQKGLSGDLPDLKRVDGTPMRIDKVFLSKERRGFLKDHRQKFGFDA